MVDVPEGSTERDREALRLTLAFYCILEREKRNQVIALAEKFVGESGDMAGGVTPQVGQ